MFDNIIIGTPLCSDQELGILESEHTLRLTHDELRNENGKLFLPNILVFLGVFKSNSDVRQSSKQREGNLTNKDPNSRCLVRELCCYEMTHFKIGKRSFWLIVGEDNK